MVDRNESSAQGKSEAPSLELIYAMGPLYRRLLAAGVTHLHIKYDAKEDKGEIQFRAKNSFGDIVTSQVCEELGNDVVAFVLMLLEQRYPNWSLGDGGAYGQIDWHLPRNDLFHKHHRRTITVITTEYSGL